MSHSEVMTEVKPGSFIFEIPGNLSPAFCDDAIARFEASAGHHYEGRIGQVMEKNLEIKRSTDMTVSDKPEWKDVDQGLFEALARAMKLVRERFPFFQGRFKDMGYAIQRTDPGGHYHWHIDGGSHEFSYRQLVAVWYLNTVDGPGGTTDFLFQDVQVRPEQGKLLLFPPFWTHEHRGAILEAGVKYIATTWVVFA